MNPRRNMQYLSIILALISLIPSLAGHSLAAGAAERPRLYADMARGEDGRWRITRITTQESRIDFITLKPVGFDQSKWDCSKMLFGAFAFSDHRECVPAGSEFRTTATRKLPTALLGASTLGASMLFGLIVEESVFDDKAFERAVAEALTNSGLEDRREELIKRFISIAEVVEEREEDLAELFRKYKDEYYMSTVPSKVEKRIEDASGLYTGDLYADMIIRVNRNHLVEYRPAPAGLLSISGTPEEFEARLAAIEASLGSRRADLEDRLKSSTRDFTVICGPEHIEPYHLKYDCPSKITGAEGERPVAVATVVSRDIKRALPEVLEAEDASVKAVFRGGKLYIENRTGATISLAGASLNYRGSSARASRNAELPPMSSIDATAIYTLVTPEIEKAASFSGMTMKEAEKTPVEVSLTVVYEQHSEKKTLRKDRVFRLSELIRAGERVTDRPAALH